MIESYFLREEISHHSSFFISTHAVWLLISFSCFLIHQGLTLLYSFNKKIETITAIVIKNQTVMVHPKFVLCITAPDMIGPTKSL